MISQTIWLVLLAAACGTAAALDLFQRRIPNLLCLATAAVGLVCAWDSGGLIGMASNGGHALLALLVGMGLFAARIVGGGDAKFYAAVALWFPLSEGLRLLMGVSIAGIVAVVVWIVARRILRRPWRDRKDDPFARFPYGVAIALGTIWAFLVKPL